MAEITISDERIYYIKGESFDTENPTILMLHGAGQSSCTWKYQLDQLSALNSHNLIIPDLPGHGSSEGGGRRTVEEYADFIAEFIERLNLKNLIFAGHSMGAAIAMLYTLRRPENVTACVLAGAGAKLKVAPKSLELAKNSYKLFCEAASERMIAEGSAQKVKDDFRAGMLSIRHEVCYNDLLACDEFDIMEEVSQITVPTLILSATDDILTPVKYGEYLHSVITKSEFHIIPGSGHFMMQEQYEQFNRILSEFLDL